MTYDKKKLIKYLIWTFALSWVLQAGAIVCVYAGIKPAFNALLTLAMFTPMIATLIVKAPFKVMGFVPRWKGLFKYILMAWLLPIALIILGTIVYFLVFPDQFSPSGEYLQAVLGETVIEQMNAVHMPIETMIVIQILQGIFLSPIVNAIPSLGEEAGWRGFMYPQLKLRFGKFRGRIYGGLIWGVWHFPVIIFAGYEYGVSYIGAPYLGPIAMLVFTISVGILLDDIEEKSRCIWLPAVAHGVINGFAAASTMLSTMAHLEERMIFGPVCVGLVGGSFFVVYAVYILIRDRKKDIFTITNEDFIQ